MSQEVQLPQSIPVFTISMDFDLDSDALGRLLWEMWMPVSAVLTKRATAVTEVAAYHGQLLYALVFPHVLVETFTMALAALCTLAHLPAIHTIPQALLWLAAHTLQLRLASYVHSTLARQVSYITRAPSPAWASTTAHAPRRAHSSSTSSEVRTTPSASNEGISIETIRQLLLPACLWLSLLCGVPGTGLALMACGMIVDAIGGAPVDMGFARRVRQSAKRDVRVRFAEPIEIGDGCAYSHERTMVSAVLEEEKVGSEEEQGGWAAHKWTEYRVIALQLAIYAITAYGARCILASTP